MKSVVVTGASSGIGRKIAQTLVAGGFRVFGSVRKASDAKAVAAPLVLIVPKRQYLFSLSLV